MATVLISFVVLGCIVAAMAVGVIFQNKPIKGSCGGISALGMGTACDICGGDTQKCEKESKKTNKNEQSNPSAGLAYDATTRD